MREALALAFVTGYLIYMPFALVVGIPKLIGCFTADGDMDQSAEEEIDGEC